MDVESLAKQLILQNMTPEQQKAVLESVRATLQEARGKQKQRVSENVGLVVDALKKIEADIRAKYDDLGNKITTRVNSIRDGRDGTNGSDGRDGLDGRPGRDGAQGPAGPAGRDGVNGVDGVDGVSVTDAKIDFDGSLIISLSNGREINVGEVVAADVAEKIRVLTYGGNSGGGGTSGLNYEGTWNASTNTPTLTSSVGTNGDYYIVSVAGSTDLNGITDWQPGDWVIFNGTVWQKIDQSWATAGVNNNITSMTGITGGISSPDFIQFDTTATVTDVTGKLYYDPDDQFQTLAFQMNGSVVQHVGENQFYRVKCSGAITKGQVVMFAGAVGVSGGLIGAAATGLTANQADYILGLAGETGANNDWITVYAFGEVKNINTTGGAEAWVQGDELYYNPLVTGGLTKTKPTTPAAIAKVAAVVYVGVSNGILFVRPSYGSLFGGMDGNVLFGTLASGNTIIYDATAGVWKNANLTDGTGITITEGAGSITITNAAPDQTVSLTGGTGISTSGTYPNFTITNSAPDQTVALTGAGTTAVTGTYPNFTITSNDQYVGTVTSVGGTGTVNGISLSGTVTSSGSLTLGGTLSGVDLTTQVTGTLPIANGGTGQTTAVAAFDALAPSQTGNSGKYLTTNGTTTSWGTISSAGTVTSVAATVPSFLSVSGSPITTSGTLAISYSGTALPVANGGTGITSFGSGVATWLGTPSSANLAAAVTGETGSGALVFGTSPTLTTPNINSAQVATVSGTAPLYMCRAWVNFNGTGTVAIRASGNVSSITDNGTGDYTVNFTVAMVDANYSMIGTSSLPSGGSDRRVVATNLNTTPTASAVRISVGYGATADDQTYVQVAIFR